MGPYGFSFALGVTGLVVMALRGVGHHGPGDAHGHAGHGGHDGHAGHVGHGHAHDASDGSSDADGHDLAAKLSHLLSPRVIFSFFVGVGATGLLAKPFLFEPLLAGAAIAGGIAFERWLVGPIWKFLFKFESRPALMLESVLMDEARAASDFDAAGQGLISLELDGQVVQLLGTLRSEDRRAEVRVRRGDLLRIEEVDAVRNRCTVSFAGQRPAGVLP